VNPNLSSAQYNPDRRWQLYSSELIARQWLSKKSFEVELTRPEGFQFKAGQTILICYQSLERYYSVITSPAEKDRIALCIRHLREGSLSLVLAGAPVGTRFDFSGPHGYFEFRPAQRPAVFVATGTGIAPFVGMARSGISGFTLLHGVRTAAELYYQSLFSRSASQYVRCLSDPAAEDREKPGIYHGKVSTYVKHRMAPGVYDFYLCGRQEMIRDMTHIVDEHFAGSLIYTEVFF
jgi:benzoate/toluate 1,2-dioxygenase reductase component